MAYIRQHPLFSMMFPLFTLWSLETSRRGAFIALFVAVCVRLQDVSIIFMPKGKPSDAQLHFFTID